MKSVPLHIQIFVAMALGSIIGLSLNFAGEAGVVTRETVLAVGAVGEWFGKVFLTLLNMIVVPLIFSSLVCSITGVGGQKGLARLGSRTIAYYLTTSLLAIIVGIVLVNIIQPGQGVDYQGLMEAARGELDTRGMKPPDVEGVGKGGVFAVLADIVYRMIPSNVFEVARSNKKILAVIFFAVVFAISTIKTGGEAAKTIDRFFRAVYDVMITMTNGILLFAPYGIAGYILFVTATTGVALASALGWYMVSVALALAIHAFVTLPLLLWFLGKRNPIVFARDMRDALLTAFSTASSAGTLPLTMQCARDNAKVPERVTSFTLPLGATVNMDGTALYEAVAVLFVAQMVMPEITMGQQVIIAVTALLASVGAAGIPHAGTVMMVIVMQAVGLPTDAVLVILSVDRVLDMCRTTVNVWSDSVGAAVIAYYEPDEEAA